MKTHATKPDAKLRTIRFGLPPHAPRRVEAAPFKAALLEGAQLSIRLLHLPSYAALFEAVDSGACDAAWSPPLVALDLERCGTASPVLALARARTAGYYSVLLASATSALRGAADLAGASIGWVAPESAAGHVIPRMHLRSLGLDTGRLFRGESFFGSHQRALDALAEGAVDVVATYAHYDAQLGRFVPPPLSIATRVLAAAGPIPADVIVVRNDVGAHHRERLTTALAGLSDAERASFVPLMNARRFVRVSSQHLNPLRALAARAADAALSPCRPFVRALPVMT
jgi:phosphonate transport system substrate-binding protein